MQLTLEVPNTLVKKLRALHLLLPEDGGDSFESIIIGLLDAAAKDAIAEIISHQEEYTSESEEEEEDVPKKERTIRQKNHAPKEHAPKKSHYETVSGLGDEDTQDEDEDDGDGMGLYDFEALVPEKGGLTERDLENDMKVTDPRSEAVFDGSGSVEEYNEEPEELFSSKMDMPTQRMRDPRIQRRLDHQKKLAKSRKGKATSFTGSEERSL